MTPGQRDGINSNLAGVCGQDNARGVELGRLERRDGGGGGGGAGGAGGGSQH